MIKGISRTYRAPAYSLLLGNYTSSTPSLDEREPRYLVNRARSYREG